MLWFSLFQILLLFLIVLGVLSLISKNFWAKSIAVILSFLLILQISSLYLTGGLIDYRFIEHANFRDVSIAIGTYIPQLLLGLGLWLGLGYLFYRLSRWIREEYTPKSLYIFAGMALSIALLCIKGGMIQSLFEVVKLKTTRSQSFVQSLRDLGIDEQDYIEQENIEAEAGKNVIILSLESMERSLLHDDLAHLSPELRKLSQQYTFIPMTELPGSDWTQGSLYTFLTGVPFFFGGNRERVFEQAQETRINSLPLIFNKAGYEQLYIMGKPEFSATDKLLEILGIDILSEKDVPGLYPSSPWGLHDVDLFTELKKAALSFHKKDKPFALYASTISTHWPDGIYDGRMEALVEKQDHPLAFSIKGLDYLIGNFMYYLEEEGILENTIVYMFPDHKFMQTLGHAGIELQEPKGLYVITTADQEDLGEDYPQGILQIDLPKLILDGAEITHNVKFLSDYIAGDKKSFIEANKANILSLNDAALKNRRFEGDLQLTIAEDDKVRLSSGGSEILLEGLGNHGTFALNLVFDEKMQVKVEQGTSQEMFLYPPNEKHLFVSKKQGILSAYLRYGKEVYAFKEGSESLMFSIAEQEEMKSARAYSERLFQNYPADFNYQVLHPNDRVEIISSSHEVPDRIHKSQIRVGERIYRLGAGITLLSRKKDLYQIDRYESFADSLSFLAFLQHVEDRLKAKEFFVLVGDVNVGKGPTYFEQRLEKLGLKKLAKLKENQAYIAYSEEGFVIEEMDDRFLAFAFPHHDIAQKRSASTLQAQSKDVSRFIAHAGGSIEGETYTNSLEALDYNYERGFRYFELDIIQTSDGSYVAAHDWEMWKKQSGYEGKLPVDLETFSKQLLFDRFHSLDMDAINKWFSEQPDAILVTDKVNDPKAFSQAFVDKSRLMMELFSLEALESGSKLGLRAAMPSMNVLNAISGDKIAYLKKLGIDDVAVSLDLLYRDLAFYQKLQANGIRTYLFHINRYPWMDETHALLFEMEYIHGIYADNWEF